MKKYTLFLNSSDTISCQRYSTIEKYYNSYNIGSNCVYVIDNETGETILSNKNMKPFEINNFVNRVFVSELNINKNHYSIIRTIIAQNYGCLTIRKETYKNGKFHSLVTNTKSLESFNLSVKTGYYKEVTNNK